MTEVLEPAQAEFNEIFDSMVADLDDGRNLFGRLADWHQAELPNEMVEDITKIDIDALVADRRRVLVLDAESTLVPWRTWRIDRDEKGKAINEWLTKAREAFALVLITTNSVPKSEDEAWLLQVWTEQVGADYTFSPLSRDQRKGSPYMLLAGEQLAEQIGIEMTPENTVMVGDKASSDILAGNLYGAHTIQVERLGEADHPGDRMVRRPLEKLAKAVGAYGIRDTVQYKPPPGAAERYSTAQNGEAAPQEPRKLKFEIPPYIVNDGRLIGYGGPEVELSPERRLRLPPPRFAEFRERIAHFEAKVKSTEAWKRYDAYTTEHGEELGEEMTELRRQLVPVMAAANAFGLPEAAFVAQFTKHVSDILDGRWVRKANPDMDSPRRKDGARKDRFVDKLAEYATVGGLVVWGIARVVRKEPHAKIKLAITAGILAGLTYREVGRMRQVDQGTADGYDTKADELSKLSTIIFSTGSSLESVRLNGGLGTKIMIGGLAAKLVTLQTSPYFWKYRAAKAQAARGAEAELTRGTEFEPPDTSPNAATRAGVIG